MAAVALKLSSLLVFNAFDDDGDWCSRLNLVTRSFVSMHPLALVSAMRARFAMVCFAIVVGALWGAIRVPYRDNGAGAMGAAGGTGSGDLQSRSG